MNLRLGYGMAALLAVPAYWPHLTRSFWVDEASTYWMVRYGFWQAIERAAGFNGQSMLYAAVASGFHTPEGPWMELVLRVPSVAAIVLMLYCASRLATRVLGPAGGFCAFVFLLFHPISLEVFAQARPYGMAAAAVAVSYWTLYEWVERRQWRWAAGYGLAVALVWHLHFVYLAGLGAQWIYLAWLFRNERGRARGGQLAAALAGAAVLALPLFPQFVRTARQAGVLSYTAQPDLVSLASELTPVPMAAVAIGLLLLGALLFRNQKGQWAAWEALALWTGWWLFAPAALFAVSQGESVRLFVTRYLGSSTMALAFVIAALAVGLFPARVVTVGALAAALVLGGPLGWWRASQPTLLEALPMIEIVRSISPAHPPPVLFHSLLAESNTLPWRNGPEGSYAFTELAAYPIPNPVYGLPMHMDADVEAHLGGILDGPLAKAPEVLIVKVGALPAWSLRAMADRGYRVELAARNYYTVGIFRRNPVP